MSSIFSFYNDDIIEWRHDMKLRVLEILKEKQKTKYWLWIQVGGSYQNFNNMVTNKTRSIRFETLQSLCDILECTPNDLFDMESDSTAD